MLTFETSDKERDTLRTLSWTEESTEKDLETLDLIMIKAIVRARSRVK